MLPRGLDLAGQSRAQRVGGIFALTEVAVAAVRDDRRRRARRAASTSTRVGALGEGGDGLVDLVHRVLVAVGRGVGALKGATASAVWRRLPASTRVCSSSFEAKWTTTAPTIAIATKNASDQPDREPDTGLLELGGQAEMTTQQRAFVLAIGRSGRF